METTLKTQAYKDYIYWKQFASSDRKYVLFIM